MTDLGCYIEIRGNKEVLIDGMSTIIDFSQERIVVLVRNKKIAINGKKLSLITMNDQRISIEGIIKSLEYISDEKISS